AVEECRDEARRSLEAADDAADLRARQHGRESPRPPRADNGVQIGQLLDEDVAIEEEKRGQRLRLGGRADGAVHGEVRDERIDLDGAHFRRVALAVKEDVAADPADVRLLGAQAVVARTDRVANAVEEPRLSRRRRRAHSEYVLSRASSRASAG